MQAQLIAGGVLFLLGAAVATVISVFASLIIGLGAGASLILMGAGLFYFFKERSSDDRMYGLVPTGLGGLCFGACLGALVGSLVPGLGTVLGAVAGGLIGLVAPVVGAILIALTVELISGMLNKSRSTSYSSTSSSSSYSPSKTYFPSSSATYERTGNSFFRAEPSNRDSSCGRSVHSSRKIMGSMG